ncbi:MAG: hypothetical protein ACT6SF_12825 [Hydrogenophaga sp.]|uniref:hypothetical protein n=1 Tax=Hydrogenophaga sp. TaxID=1904254 RepID=UPI004037125A
MPSVHTSDLPADVLVGKYHRGGAYSNRYAVDVNPLVSRAACVEAFYALAVCKLKRQLLAWFGSKSEPIHVKGSPDTRLDFGSVVVPMVDRRAGQSTISWPLRALLGFHKLYWSVLLHATISRLARPSAIGPDHAA